MNSINHPFETHECFYLSNQQNFLVSLVSFHNFDGLFKIIVYGVLFGVCIWFSFIECRF